MLDIIVNELSKILIMLLLFCFIGKPLNYIVCLLALAMIRNFSGGFHIKSFIGCLLFTNVFFLTCLYIPDFIIIDYKIFIILYVFSITVMGLISPKPSKQRGTYSSYQKLKFKLKSMITTTVFFFILLFKMNNPYLINIVWVIVLQSFQLLFTEGRDRFANSKKFI